MKTNDKKPTGKILVTTDFSDPSYGAFHYAQNEARARSMEIELVNVFEEPIIPASIYDFLPPVAVSDEIRKELYKATEKKLKETKKSFSGDVSVSTKVLEQKYSVGETIVEYAARTQAELVVIASQGHGFLARVLLGSVAESVLRHASCPVIVVPGDEAKSVSKEATYKNVIVTTDFSPYSENSFNIAKEFTERGGVTLTVLHVIESPYAPELLRMEWKDSSEDARQIQARYRAGIEDRLQELVRKLGGDRITGAAIEKVYSVPHTIAKFARDSKADLVVIATKGVGKRTILIGGIVERLARQMPCSVMTVPGGRF